ncbi:hypothetical protein H2202_006239 [Exophiala xenobiotica]|nr:hypothetical protein H2202_006239 [Exophiala xenobiotica]KAK5203809.1 hypothetical protein LTR41_010494 [Exophiala xenobiotica]KAK5216282.1 hypothetical protein LTR72_010676 [Exophiala xenobiotica]KAK5224326.1 hypothetical protein LTR47_009761 [Exophiala xenobiotica]KAK5247742.1 hypothetical protein LTS06_007135 [Exophiala xenobiotica]
MSLQDSFPVVDSVLDLQQPQYKSNRDAWTQVMDEFAANLKTTTSQGSTQSTQRHEDRGQLLARDRIALLLDPRSSFLELGSFAGFGLEDSSPCASLLAGIGSINGRICLILSHIATQSGGAWNELTVVKQNRVTEIANENDLPLIALVQSAGVFLPQQFRVFHKAGQIFRDLAVRTQNGQPSCAVVFGSSTAGGAYHPALSDYTIFVENQAQVFLAGPPLVKMATGEVIGAEELGGARVHGSITGLADHVAVDEFDAIRKAREWVALLRPPRSRLTQALRPVLAPRYPIEDIFALVNPDIRKPFDMKEVVLRLVDDSRLAIFKPDFGRSLLTGWACIMGMPLGIVANQTPIINPDEAMKGAQFVRMCNQENTPILFLHNVTGFMVGSKVEHASIIKKGAQFVSAVSCSKVPHISIIFGASYGAGNYAMCGRTYKPRFMFTWPIGRCSVMGAEQLSGVMEQIEANSAKSRGIQPNPEQVRERTRRHREEVERDSRCYRTSAMLIDDGIIDPRDTRDVLGMCLEIVQTPGVEGSAGHRALARI